MVSLSVLLAAAAARAADTCECADIADLRNRETEERAAIQAYRDAIARWGNAPPDAEETLRKHFQYDEIQPAINQVTTSGTNKARGVTDASCRTTIEPTSACMQEVAAQHEEQHAAACHAYRTSHTLPTSRFSTLADYAREEIDAYEAEAAYVHGALVDLTSKCQLQIEMKSEIRGGMEVAISNATGNVLATYTAPDHQPTTPYRGTGTLQYQTKDVGPPRKVGDRMLMKLAPVCYATAVGSGTTPFNVIDGYLWRSNVAPYEPRLDLVFEISPTRETRILKGQRGCPKSSESFEFWSELFIADKTATTAQNHVLIDGWTFEPRAGVYAEKVITGTCGPTTTVPGPLAAYGPFARCAEKTTFTVRLKR
ncbi:MAG TPA: hypothetical protein VFP37_08370 [Steroidobacteraceae bacterium]|nr:hypothetical protein [Steroidobacteraceae bacterium]